jgi:tRNA1Val (adenine37-N6)-methyltransferase
MANSYFKFKQFKIHQHKCAMKVCTDACLFGALVAELNLEKKQVLDTGTGTGLLSLMLAQKSNSIQIDAVEIEAAAAEQALENITASPWSANINVHHADILQFKPGKNYNLIISNPPFFEDDLHSPDATKNKAKHSTTLKLDELLHFVDENLDSKGTFAVLLPYARVQAFTDAASETGLLLNRQVLVKQTMKHKFFRGILFFGRKEKEAQYEELIIKELDHSYTAAFTNLLKDYYLFL